MSRYSIVERLTKTKMGFMDEKNSLSDETKQLEQDIDNKTNALENWKTDVEEDVKRTKRIKEREIEVATKNLKHKKERVTDLQKHYESKIIEIDKALKSIEDISKTAPAPQEQV